MTLKPQDLYVAFKLVLTNGATFPSYNELGHSLGMSPSQVYSSVQRLIESRLLTIDRNLNRTALFEFVVHGAPYAFYAKHGVVTRGIATSHAALPLSNDIIGDGLPLVWPCVDGNVRGEAIEPLHKSVPDAVQNDAQLYELLALFDALRTGRTREQNHAVKYFKQRLRA